MDSVIRGRVEIDRRLRQLRSADNHDLVGPRRWLLDCLLEMHFITVDPGPEDYFHGREVPLRHFLSLLDADHLRGRVSEIRLRPPAADRHDFRPSHTPPPGAPKATP